MWIGARFTHLCLCGSEMIMCLYIFLLPGVDVYEYVLWHLFSGDVYFGN